MEYRAVSTPLDEIFGQSSAPAEAAPTVEAAPVVEQTTQVAAEPVTENKGETAIPGQPRDEHGRFAPNAPAQAEPAKTDAAPPAANSEPSHIPITALLDERDKRKAAQREADELRRWKAEQEAKAAQPAEQPKAPDLYQDPEAFAKHFEQQVEQRLSQQRLALSESWAKRNHADYDDTMKVFEGMAQANPAMVKQMLAEADPAEWAYQQATQHKRMQEIGADPDAWAKRRALELLEQDEALRAEIVGKYAPQPSPAPTPAAPPVQLPTSLAAVTSSGARTAAPWQGPTPLETLFTRR